MIASATRAHASWLLLTTFACASGCEVMLARPSAACPAPFDSDAPREARIQALLAADPEAKAAVDGLPSVCFGPTRSPGVLIDGRPMLDVHGSDAELGARLAHLGVHVHDDLGDGCRLGKARAVASEQRARALESRLRARAGLGPPSDEAREPIADYSARCTRP